MRKVMGRHCFTSLETHEVYHHSDFLFHGAVQDRNSMICTSSLADENGFQYLFVWALVTKRFQIAHFLLLHMTEICAAALFAAEFLRQMAHLHCTPSEREELERVAIDVGGPWKGNGSMESMISKHFRDHDVTYYSTSPEEPGAKDIRSVTALDQKHY
ncbi:unnamed protein product [Schistocephalus solidus]|uniref:TRPM-like domain-containing protein n=1 Tax=Schistocephalus solidus TaxID=70667 RepID=A0A3P7DRE4_SCHSO|nr:unnamed protein product [Schistocephalus solidus]